MLKRIVSTAIIPLVCSCGIQGVQTSQSSKEKSKNLNQLTAPTAKEIEMLEKEKQYFSTQNNAVGVADAQLQINHLVELQNIDLSAADAATQIAELKSKYDLLRLIFENEKSTFQETGFVNAEQKNAYREGILKGPNFTSVYHPDSLREVQKVFKDFGDLYIDEHRTNDEGRPVARVVQAAERPWAGFWYPVQSNFLYSGENAPLRKFDRLLEKLGVENPQVALKEQKRYSGYRPDMWEGLCDARSIASSMVSEPKESKWIEGIEFEIADQKAIHTYAHLGWETKQYGISYNGSPDTDGTYQDIRPEGFHRIVTAVLGKEKRALVVDDTAGVQVWNKPLYRYRWTVEKDPKLNYAFLVRGYPWLVKERDEESNRLTKGSDILSPVYTFRLYVDKSVRKKNRFKVVAGQWTDRSYSDHPDNINYPIKNSKPSSHSSEFNKYLQVYEKYFLNSEG